MSLASLVLQALSSARRKKSCCSCRACALIVASAETSQLVPVLARQAPFFIGILGICLVRALAALTVVLIVWSSSDFHALTWQTSAHTSLSMVSTFLRGHQSGLINAMATRTSRSRPAEHTQPRPSRDTYGLRQIHVTLLVIRSMGCVHRRNSWTSSTQESHTCYITIKRTGGCITLPTHRM